MRLTVLPEAATAPDRIHHLKSPLPGGYHFFCEHGTPTPRQGNGPPMKVRPLPGLPQIKLVTPGI